MLKNSIIYIKNSKFYVLKIPKSRNFVLNNLNFIVKNANYFGIKIHNFSIIRVIFNFSKNSNFYKNSQFFSLLIKIFNL